MPNSSARQRTAADLWRATARVAAYSAIAVAGLLQSANAQTFPEVPASNTTAAQDRAQMMSQVGVEVPVLPSKLLDPNRPPSAYPSNVAQPEGNWRNFYGHMITRSQWGLWNNYEDTSNGMLHADGFNGWDKFTVNDPDSWRVFDDATSTYAQSSYTPIDLLRMKDGTKVLTAEDWWTKRRPEILKDVQEQLYGKIPDRSLWPAITWQLGAVTEGTQNGVAYRQRTITGVIDISSYPELRNRPSISGTLRVPKAQFDAGESVPVIIGFGGVTWASVAPRGWGTISFSQGAVQGGGGANMSSWIIGLFNKGGWRKPDDMGTLAAWAWGVGRLIDRLETPVPSDPTLITPANEFLGVNVKKLGITGHSFLGKATIVTMAYEPRLLIAYPSRGGSGGPKMNRRHWGQDLENSLGSDSEYYWYAGNAFKFVGALNGPGSGSVENAADLPASGPYPGNNAATWRTLTPAAGAATQRGTYLPRKLELMTIDAHSLVALAAPRPVFTNGGTHDSWTDQRGMWLTQVFATPVYNLLGRKGLVDITWPFDANYVPQSPVTIHTPVIRNFGGYIDGHLGYRFAGEALHPEVPGEGASTGGHTAADDMPAFVNFAAKFFDDVTPPMLPLIHDFTSEIQSHRGGRVEYTKLMPATDTVDDTVPTTFSPASGSFFPLGTTIVTATATDVSGNTATQTFKVNIVDTLPPEFAKLSVSPAVLAPADGKMIAVTVTAKPDDKGDTAPVVRILSVTSNQPAGDDADWNITGQLTAQLRAQAQGGPRVYTITVEARDASGNARTKTVTVTVP